MAVKNEKGRAAVVKNAAYAVLENSNMMEDQGADLPKDLRKEKMVGQASRSLTLKHIEKGSGRLLKLGSGCYGVDRRCGGAEAKGVAGLVGSGVETEIRS